MKYETQVETLQTLLKLRERDLDQESMGRIVRVPVSAYTEPGILERELTTVFRNSPLVAGHASQVREPGSYILGVWDRLPYVVVRDKAGTLRAFLNVCRHRGARLVSGEEKQLQAIVCPFHGWVYGLDGSLKGVTKPYNFPCLDHSQHGLKELSVAEHMGLIWVHPASGARIDLDSYLGAAISSDLQHFGLDQFVLHRKSVTTKHSNWKLLLKTYLERYHVPILHRNTIAPVFQKGVIAHFQYGPHIRIAAARTHLPDVLKADRASWRILDYASVFYTLFPNTFLIFHANIVSLNSFYPEAPDRTIWTHEMLYRESDYAGTEGQEALAKRFANIDGVFSQEDFGIVEGLQANFRCGANDFHLLGLEEGLLAIFQENIDRRLAPPAGQCSGDGFAQETTRQARAANGSRTENHVCD
jgi:carnitine monooxygenase subunit